MKNKYYNTVNVTSENLHTGNHCVNGSQLANLKKFNFIIGDDSYVLTPLKVITYINNHPECIRYKYYDFVEGDYVTKRRSYPFYLIPDEYIKANAA